MRAASVQELVAAIPSGATVALGGAGLQRKPMALVRALADAGARDLRVVAFLGSVDVEYLLGAGSVAELHAAGVALDGAGLAPRYRAARQAGAPPFVEWSEGLLLCALEAAARGVPSLPAWMGVGSDLPRLNPHLREVDDPFTGERVMQVRALEVDVALLHVPGVDEHGHAYVAGDLAVDGVLARAAARTLVSYEGEVPGDPERAALSRLWITATAPAPDGAWPTGCHPVHLPDLQAVMGWARGGAEGHLDLLRPAGVER